MYVFLFSITLATVHEVANGNLTAMPTLHSHCPKHLCLLRCVLTGKKSFVKEEKMTCQMPPDRSHEELVAQAAAQAGWFDGFASIFFLQSSHLL